MEGLEKEWKSSIKDNFSCSDASYVSRPQPPVRHLVAHAGKLHR